MAIGADEKLPNADWHADSPDAHAPGSWVRAALAPAPTSLGYAEGAAVVLRAVLAMTALDRWRARGDDPSCVVVVGGDEPRVRWPLSESDAAGGPRPIEAGRAPLERPVGDAADERLIRYDNRDFAPFLRP